MNTALVCSIPKREHFFQLHFQMFSLHLGRIISTNHAKNKNIIKMTFRQKIQFNFKGHHYIPSWPHEKVTAQWETYFIWTLKCKFIVFVLKSLANSSGLAWHYGPLWCNFNLTSSRLVIYLSDCRWQCCCRNRMSLPFAGWQILRRQYIK